MGTLQLPFLTTVLGRLRIRWRALSLRFLILHLEKERR